MTQNNDNAIQNDFGQRILVKEVKSFSQIRQLDDKLAVTAIYKLKEKENERIFASHPVQACHWLAEKFNLDELQNSFYICPYGVSIVKDWDIKYEHCSSKVTVTLDMEVKLNLEQSDSGKSLVNWLAGHGWRVDQSSLENYLENKITSGFLENTLGLYNRPWDELNGCLKLNVDAIQEIVGSWLQVKECVVRKVAVKTSQTWLDRNKTLKENAKIQQKHQDEIKKLHMEAEKLTASIEVENLKQEYEKLKAKQLTDLEQTRLDEKYKMISDMYNYQKDEKKNGSESTSSNDWPVGHKINGKYIVIALPREGSIGKVYKCWDEIGKVNVAVKRLSHGSFQSEAKMKGVWENYQLISGFDHQNIAHYKALEIDETTGDNYLVMEYVEGAELCDWMSHLREERNMARRLKEALPVLRKIADALYDVHKKHVIHRDVKPDNVKIKSDGTVKVLDFGLAAAIDPATHTAYIPDKVIASAGSDGYKSPEQWKALCDQGPSVDQYSLAVIAYQMLSGQLPFKGGNKEEEKELRQEVLGKNPKKVKGLPRYANKALRKALSKEAADRYPSCVEFVNALGAGKAEANNEVWRTWAVVAAVLMLIAVLGGVYAWKGQSFKTTFWGDKTNLSPTYSGEVEEEKEARKEALEKQLEAEKKKTKELEAKVAAGEEAKKALEAEKGKEAELAAKVAAREEATKALEKQLADEKKKTVELAAKVAAGEEAKKALEAKASTAAERKIENGDFTLMLPGNVPLELVHIHAGSFTMGSPIDEPGRFDDETQHLVTLTKDFWLGKYEVTQGQWKAVMGTTLLDQVNLHQANIARPHEVNKYIGNIGDDYPMYCVNWNEALEFCRTLTERERSAGRLPTGYEYTLPTEAQWEYTCRAGTTTALFNGIIVFLGENNAPALDGVAWYSGNSSVGYEGAGWDTKDWPNKQYPSGMAGPRKVGGKKPNRWGLYDMIGNIYEWCLDWYGDYPTGSVTDPTGPSSGSLRVIRGGSWYDYARNCRSAGRPSDDPRGRYINYGFRVALSQAESIPTTQPAEKPSSASVKPTYQINSQVSSERSQSKVVLLPGIVPLELVHIHAGSFMMGSPMDEPDRDVGEFQHRVTLTKDYWLGKYEVTQGQWKAVMGSNLWKAITGSNPSEFKKGDRYPVEQVSWEDAMDFCRKLTKQERSAGRLPMGYEYTLPTEAQWEYACRAGTTTPFSFGSTLNGDKAHCNGNYPYGMGKEKYLASTTSVGSYAPNAWGLYDMHGDVWEWCRDSYGDYPTGSVTDPVGPSSGSRRVLRGGSWFNFAGGCRSAKRINCAPMCRGSDIGFRVALAPVQ